MSQEWLWIFTIMSLTGAYMNSKGDLLTSSIVWLMANLCWFCVDLYNGIYPQAGLYLAFICLNILGIRTSLKNKPKESSKYDITDY